MPLTKIECCQGGSRDPSFCVNCALHGDPAPCEYPLPMLTSMEQAIGSGRGYVGDFSATQFQACPRFVRLAQEEDFAESPADWYARWRGTISHTGCEVEVGKWRKEKQREAYQYFGGDRYRPMQDEVDSVNTERRIFRKLELNGREYTISGTYDLKLSDYQGGVRIEDYKNTQRPKQMVTSPDHDYVMQASIYAWLLEPTEHITSYRVWYLCPDGVTHYDIELPGLETTESYLRNRLAVLTEEDLPAPLPTKTVNHRDGTSTTQLHYKCVRCPLKTECWSRVGFAAVGNKLFPAGTAPAQEAESADDPFGHWLES